MRQCIALTVFASSVLLSRAHAQAPILSPFHELVGDAQVGLATGDQLTPAISKGASSSLVVWADRRTSLSSNSAASESGLDIFALRLDANGQRIESVPLALGMTPGTDAEPQVAWNGQNWLVAWKSQAPFNSQYAASMVGVRVSPAGQVLDATPITILGYAFSDIGTHALASDGANWVVVAQGTSAGYANLRAARVSPAGVVLDPTPVQLFPEGQLTTVRLAHAQSSYLLVWSQYSSANGDDVVGRRFSSALVWQDAAPFAIGATSMDDARAQVGSNGTQFFVVWDRPVSISRDILGARVQPSGQVLDTTPITLSGLFWYGAGASCAPVFDGTHWITSWDNYGPRFARVTGAGVVLDPDGFVADPNPNSTLVQPQCAPHAAGGVQVVWGDDRAGSYEGLDVFTTRIVDANNLGTHVGISSGTSAQVTPDLAHGAGQSLLVFRSETSGARRILATRLDSAGLALDAQPIEIAAGLLEGQPSVAWDGSEYLIAWESGASSSVLARRMAPNGALLDAAPIVVGIGSSPEVAALNGEFLVSYTRSFAFPVQQLVHVVRVRGLDGIVLGPPSAINSTFAVDPDVCVVGNRWLVVWQRNYSVSDTHCDVNAAFVDASGVASAPFAVAGSFNAYNHSVSVASSGTEALITWVFGNSSNLTRRVHSRRIRDDGTFLDAAPVVLAAGASGERFNPSVAWNGNDYVVAFQDLRAATSMLDQRSDLYGARVTPGGALLDPQGFVIEASSISEVGPALVGSGGGRVLLASSRFLADATHASFRVGTRTVDGQCPQPTVYCTSKTTSIGTLPAIGFTGSASVAANDFRLTLASALPNANAIYFYGSAQAAMPWFGGWRCVSLPVTRSPLTQLDAVGAGQAAPALSAALIGQTRCFQWWTRDGAHPDGTGVSLSAALSVTFCP